MYRIRLMNTVLKGTPRYTKAAKERWEGIPDEVRVKRMRAVALARWEKATPAQRRKQGILMRKGHTK